MDIIVSDQFARADSNTRSFAFTADANGTTTLSNPSTLTGLAVYQTLTGTGVPANTTIQSINNTGTLATSTITLNNTITTGTTVSFTAGGTACGIPDSWVTPDDGTPWRETGNGSLTAPVYTWGLVGNQLVQAGTGLTVVNTKLLRPAQTLYFRQQQIVNYILGATGTNLWLLFRDQSTATTKGSGFNIILSYNTVNVLYNNGSATGSAGWTSQSISPTLSTTLEYIVQASIIPVTSSTANCTVTISERVSGNIVFSNSQTLSGYASTLNSVAGTNQTGRMGIAGNNNGLKITSIVQYEEQDSNLSTSVTAVRPSATGDNIVITSATADWISSPPTFTIANQSGTASVVKNAQYIIDANTAVLNITTGSGTGTLRITDPTQATLNTVDISVSASSSLVFPRPKTLDSVGSNDIRVRVLPPGGGLPPYTITSYQGPANRTTPLSYDPVSQGQVIAATLTTESGTGCQILSFNPGDDRTWGIKFRATDSAGSPSSINSKWTTGYRGFIYPTAANTTIPDSTYSATVLNHADSKGVPTATIAPYLAVNATQVYAAQGGSRFTDYDPTTTAVTTVVVNCSVTNGSTAITLSSATGILQWMTVYGTGIGTNCVLSGLSGTAGTLSDPYTGATNASLSLTFKINSATPYGYWTLTAMNQRGRTLKYYYDTYSAARFISFTVLGTNQETALSKYVTALTNFYNGLASSGYLGVHMAMFPDVIPIYSDIQNDQAILYGDSLQDYANANPSKLVIGDRSLHIVPIGRDADYSSIHWLTAMQVQASIGFAKAINNYMIANSAIYSSGTVGRPRLRPPLFIFV